MVLAVWAVVCAALAFQILRISGEPTSWLRMASGVGVTVSLSTGFAWLLREGYKLRIEPEGLSMGWSKLVPWNEITSVSQERLPLGKRGLAIRSTNHPTVAVLESIASSTTFRDALEKWCPEGHPLREAVITDRRQI